MISELTRARMSASARMRRKRDQACEHGRVGSDRGAGVKPEAGQGGAVRVGDPGRPASREKLPRDTLGAPWAR
jgi:hypothetical protein